MADISEFVKNYKSRKSPQGIREFIVPAAMEDGRFPPGVMAYTTPDPLIFYREKYADRPEIQRHERIHAGQSMIMPPSLEQMREVWPNVMSEAKQYGDTADYEIPAYEFMFDKDKRGDRQKLLNAYLSMMNRRNANNAEPLEAAMDESMLREFIKKHPAAIAPPKVIK